MQIGNYMRKSYIIYRTYILPEKKLPQDTTRGTESIDELQV